MIHRNQPRIWKWIKSRARRRRARIFTASALERRRDSAFRRWCVADDASVREQRKFFDKDAR